MKTPTVLTPHHAAAGHQARASVAATSHQATQATLTKARALVTQTANRLAETRAGHSEQARQLSQTRLIDLICQELKVEFGAPETLPRAANHDLLPGATGGSTAPVAAMTASRSGSLGDRTPHAAVDPASHAQAAVELIEQIETFVKSQRPGLSLTLNSSLGARVEIERIGPREVALKVIGANGPPKAEDLGRIRDEMRARGLKVGALSVA